MMSTLSLLLLLAAAARLATAAWSPVNTSHCINVRDFGARGDGITDDSSAIQAAVHAAIASEKDFPISSPPIGGKPGVRQHNLVGGPDLCFSPGDYRITRTIELSPLIPGGVPDAHGVLPVASPPNVRGIGKVNVRLNSTTVDIFSAVSTSRMSCVFCHCAPLNHGWYVRLVRSQRSGGTSLVSRWSAAGPSC